MGSTIKRYLATGGLFQLVFIPWLIGLPTFCAIVAARVFARGLPLVSTWDWVRLVGLVVVTWLVALLTAAVLGSIAMVALGPLFDAIERWAGAGDPQASTAGSPGTSSPASHQPHSD